MKLQTQVNHAAFSQYLEYVRKLYNVVELPSIHRDEFDKTYQIYKEGLWHVIGRHDPPNDYLIFDLLGIYQQNDKINTTK